VKHPVFNADEEGRQFPAEQMALIKSNVREQCQVLMRSWMV
jgi:DUF917 family protein